jgi:hypothetical protein
MYMNWMHIKSLQNARLKQIDDHRQSISRRTACRRRGPSPYPIRAIVKHPFETIGGFRQHPNSSNS